MEMEVFKIKVIKFVNCSIIFDNFVCSEKFVFSDDDDDDKDGWVDVWYWMNFWIVYVGLLNL